MSKPKTKTLYAICPNCRKPVPISETCAHCSSPAIGTFVWSSKKDGVCVYASLCQSHAEKIVDRDNLHKIFKN